MSCLVASKTGCVARPGCDEVGDIPQQYRSLRCCCASDANDANVGPSPGPMQLPQLKPQEILLDDPQSCNMFEPGPERPFVATRAAIEMYSREVIVACLDVLRQKAAENDGLDYLQVFVPANGAQPERLWFIEDGPGGAINALLPTDY